LSLAALSFKNSDARATAQGMCVHNSQGRTCDACHVEPTDEELRNAPATAPGQEFDWGDRSREIEIHNYYRVPPYWVAY
jgi:cytochrome c5